MREGLRRRTAARLAAVQALFQADQAALGAEAVIEEFLKHRLGQPSGPAGHGASGHAGYEEGRVPEAEAALFARIVRAASREQPARDALLTASLPADWPLHRLDPVLLALLRGGLAELAMPDGPPAKVVINEYVDVAHAFFDSEEPRLVNAVLDHLARQLRAAEFPNPAGP